MGIISYIAQVEAMVDADLYASRRIIAGKPTGIGNETKPYTHCKVKKKTFGERKLSKKQRIKKVMKKEIIGTCELCGKLIYDDNDFHMDDEGIEMCDKCYQESLQEEIIPND